MKSLITVLTLTAALGLATASYADENADAATSNENNTASQTAQSVSFADETQNTNDELASFKDVIYSMVAMDDETETDNNNVAELIDEDDVFGVDALSNPENTAAQPLLKL